MEDRYRVVIRKRVVVDRQDIYRIDNEIARRQINDRWKTDIGKIGDRCQLDRRKTPDYQKIDNRYIEDSISSIPPATRPQPLPLWPPWSQPQQQWQPGQPFIVGQAAPAERQVGISQLLIQTSIRALSPRLGTPLTHLKT